MVSDQPSIEQCVLLVEREFLFKPVHGGGTEMLSITLWLRAAVLHY